VNFLVDAQLSPALAGWINQTGHHAEHVFELNLSSADDEEIWNHARAHDFVIISKDEDFVDRWLLNDNQVRLIWIRKGNCSTIELLDWYRPFWTQITERLAAGERLIELRG
jgi:predicted nuclease of predicted toxin-antitoxin system